MLGSAGGGRGTLEKGAAWSDRNSGSRGAAELGQTGEALSEWPRSSTLQARMLSQRGVSLSHSGFRRTHCGGGHLGGSVAWASNS